MFTAFYALASKGGVPVARDYLWQPIDRHAYTKIGDFAFYKFLTRSIDIYGNEDANSLWAATQNGLCFRLAFRSALFQVIPTAVDLCLVPVVLYWTFGVYMAMISSVIIFVTLWSSRSITYRQRRKSMQIAVDMSEEYNAFNDSITNWRMGDRTPGDHARYHDAVTKQSKTSLQCFQWIHFEAVVQSALLTLGLMGACLLVAYQITHEGKSVGSFVMLVAYWAQVSGPLQLLFNELRGVAHRVRNATELFELLGREATLTSPPSRAQPQVPVMQTRNEGRTQQADIPARTETSIDKPVEASIAPVIRPTATVPQAEASTTRKGSSGTIGRTMVWKPDVPEFIPASQRSAAEDQKENLPAPDNAGVKPDDMEAGVVLRSPKKPKKKGRGSKKAQILRRQLTKSVPEGIDMV